MSSYQALVQRECPDAGTGIGLAVVRRAVERMGGRVRLDSAPGRGSRFTIELPESA